MNTQSISLDLPSDILLTLNQNETELKQNIKLSFAIRLYQSGRLSIGKASEIAGISRYDFETFLSENNFPISNLTLEDVLNDIEKLK